MSNTASNVSPRQDTFWWQGSLMEIKARAEDTNKPASLPGRRTKDRS